MATLLLALRQENPENEEERELQAWFSKLSENFTTRKRCYCTIVKSSTV